MPLYATAAIDFFDGGEIKLKTINAGDWKTALVELLPNWKEAILSLPDDLKAAQEQGFDQNWAFTVIEVRQK